MGRKIRLAGIVLAALAASPGWAAGTDTDEVATDAAADFSESQQEARAMLIEMAEFLAGLDSFSVKLISGFDVMQESGQKIQFLEARDIVLERPDRMRAEEQRGDGLGRLVLFDGSKVTVWHGESGVFAQADQPGSVDDTVVYFERDLGMRLPLAGLLTTRLPSELERRIRMVDYVEMTDVLGEPAHHLAGRTNGLDIQVWITAGKRPLPIRIVLTYPDAGRPQFWAQFSEWNLRPRTRDAMFAFKAPQDARQIPFAVQISMMGDSLSDGATVEGEKP